MLERVRRWLNTLLVLDVFLVLLGFAGLVVALLGRPVWPGLWQGWLWLWQPLWQPAIGLLILGALVTGGLNVLGRAVRSISGNSPR
ncbi:hypothetical protein [Gloeomargarita sp.]